MQSTFIVHFADGDNFDRIFSTAVSVIADSELDRRLIAEQMAMTPMVGKPDHIQVIAIEEYFA